MIGNAMGEEEPKPTIWRRAQERLGPPVRSSFDKLRTNRGGGSWEEAEVSEQIASSDRRFCAES